MRHRAGRGTFVLAQEKLGYDTTPILPGTKCMCTTATGAARIVTPAATFSQTAPAPSDATMLFDGKDLSKWQSGRGTAAQWKIETLHGGESHGQHPHERQVRGFPAAS